MLIIPEDSVFKCLLDAIFSNIDFKIMLVHDVNVHLYSTDHLYIEDMMKKSGKNCLKLKDHQTR